MKDFGENLRAARLRAKLTQRQAAKRAGVPQPKWSGYENGLAEPKLTTLYRLAKAVGVPVEVLL